VILPLFMWTFTAATQSLMFLVNSGIWIARGQSLASFYAPFYARMMLVSAFARRAALLWAALIPR